MPQQAATPPSDQTTWMLAVRDSRDRAAFAQLFDHYAPRLKGFVMRSGTPAAEAEEIVQEVMLRVWNKSAQFDPAQSQVSGWIYAIARNAHVDHIRRSTRPIPEDLPTTDAAPDAEQVIGLDQEAAKLRAALANLSADQRMLIERAYLGDLSHSEIQTETGLPLGTIKSRIRLGLDKLRHELKNLRTP